ncbi:MAG: hypothetical protein ACK2U1_15005 [Anaerolineales bacterium]
MKNKASWIFIVLGFLFLLNAIFGRYLVLPGYLASLEQGQSTVASVSQTVSGWKIGRYLLWAYSFKLGIYFLILGAMLRTKMSTKRKWLIAVVGFVYISFAYMPLPEPTSPVFGIAGGIITLLMIFIFFRWSSQRAQLSEDQKIASDYRMAGYFFFAMATYTLCPLLGVKAFALAPEKMIQYGLQAEAASFAFHVLIELLLSWSFTALSYRTPK